jgi:hypothetical protein
MENLRQLMDEDIISESQYKKALLGLFGPLTSSEMDLSALPEQAASVVLK